MDFVSASVDFVAGWVVWSLGHNLGHRWWHDEMRKGKQTFYAHGERQHHVIYDEHGAFAQQAVVDPKELFISFPLPFVGSVGLLFVALYGWLRGWEHSWGFGVGLLGFMILDHQLHILFHKKEEMGGWLGRFQKMHQVHHATHNRNYFFVSGWVWDYLLGTAMTEIDHIEPLIERPQS